eukprot:TRINITY_DN60624_c0_g1_i1.p1 TRINITY_DN60624_c0_g1~~TRINITY_DN60624_c0_g1_i1.p1  ORF type:complete len:290 (+),score=28.74 TRINITY_DN60624_c0_g1_i1:36-905(+)
MLIYASLFGSLILVVALTVAKHLPQPFPDRLAVIAESSTIIDNVSPYDSVDKWSKNGLQAGLHVLNPVRVSYFDKVIRETVKPPFHVLDVGCGGGLVANALGELDGYASVEGVDMSTAALDYAKQDAALRNLSHVRYRNASVYSLPFEAHSFDVVVMSDVLEHLTDVVRALVEIARVLKPGGIFVFDTINRSYLTLFVAILGAEYITRLVPRGTHDWRLFLKPDELRQALRLAGLGNIQHAAFDPSLRSLVELSLFSAGLISSDAMSGNWIVGPPSDAMVSYIGYATST